MGSMVTTFLAPLDLLWDLGGMMDKGDGKIVLVFDMGQVLVVKPADSGIPAMDKLFCEPTLISADAPDVGN